MPPLCLHAPGAVLKAEGVDCLFRETARARRASESLPALRRVVMAEATRRLGSPISLDLFATADNTLVPCFFARHPEPLAEGADALAKPDWGLSRCSCGLMHRECVFAFRLEVSCWSSWRRRARTACVGLCLSVQAI